MHSCCLNTYVHASRRCTHHHMMHWALPLRLQCHPQRRDAQLHTQRLVASGSPAAQNACMQGRRAVHLCRARSRGTQSWALRHERRLRCKRGGARRRKRRKSSHGGAHGDVVSGHDCSGECLIWFGRISQTLVRLGTFLSSAGFFFVLVIAVRPLLIG